jgi:hypothetical protein
VRPCSLVATAEAVSSPPSPIPPCPSDTARCTPSAISIPACFPVRDGDRDRPVGPFLADDRLVAADAEDEDPRRRRVLATIGVHRARRPVLLALPAAHDAQRAHELMVDRLRDPGAVGGKPRRPQDHDHEQQDGDVVDAGLAAIGRSWGALSGHPVTVAVTASRNNRVYVTRGRRGCVSGAGTSGPRSAHGRRRGRGRRR